MPPLSTLAPRFNIAWLVLALGDAPAADLKMPLDPTRIPADHPFRAKADGRLVEIDVQLRAGTTL